MYFYAKHLFLSSAILLTLCVATFTHAQTPATTYSYEVKPLSKYLSMSPESLAEAESLSDIVHLETDRNVGFKSDWVKNYVSVTIHLEHQDHEKVATGNNDKFTSEQKELLKLADSGNKIEFLIKYYPNNTLSNNSEKEIKFTVHVEPEHSAGFPGGEEALSDYLKNSKIDQLGQKYFSGMDVMAIQFTVNENGEVVDVKPHESVFSSTDNEERDHYILRVVENMPCWNPAVSKLGDHVKQDFVLVVGNMQNCMVHNLSTPR